MSVLASLDFSPVTESVLVRLPELLLPDEPLHLLYVGEPEPSFVGFDAGSEAAERPWEEALERARARLEEAAERLRADGLTVHTHLVRGVIPEEILGTAKELDARLLVLGSHGHSLLYDVLVGSVAEAVLQRTTRPLVLIPAEASEG